MKNHSSRRAARPGNAAFRTPSLYKANKAERAKHFKQNTQSKQIRQSAYSA